MIAIEEFFIEQAEYINKDNFDKWSTSHPDEENIIRKLTQGGAKLISGPRGCGKTTLLKKAYLSSLDSKLKPFPVYVNYKKSFSLEPIYASGKNGTHWFNQWVILKVYQGIYDALDSLNLSAKLEVSKNDAFFNAELIENSRIESLHEDFISINQLEADINKILIISGRDKCVLLLDDAAHAFSAAQQRDFFDFFRNIKSRDISPKAAIYPGVTNFSSSFHVGHDAEYIDVWIKPDSDEYLSFMKSVIDSRFDEHINNLIESNSASIDLLIYAAFGVPRSLLNMIQALMKSGEGAEDVTLDLSRNEVLKTIKNHYKNTQALFKSISVKLPVYKNFVNSGEEILVNSISLIKEYNKNKDENFQSVSIAIPENDLDSDFSRVFEFFQYAGLCIPKEGSISRGEKGKFKLFTIHYAALIDANALFSKKSINISSYVNAFANRNAHEFTRTQAKHLIPDLNSAKFSLELPPCGNCHEPRLNEQAKFCFKCGSPLKESSSYKKLVNLDICYLPLTAQRVSKIKKQSTIRTIKDILVDQQHTQLLNVDYIGPYWAEKIVRLAEEFVE